MKNPFYQRSLLKLLDFSRVEIQTLLDTALYLKQQKQLNNKEKHLQGKNIALIFEKSSTRTRIAFEVAAYDLGANVTYLSPSGSQIGYKESMKDTARVLGRMYDAIQYRGFSQETLQVLDKYSKVPVYNGLTDEFHPTQGLADLMTMLEHSEKKLAEIAFCFVGDCRFNMANTLLLAGAIMGMDVRLLSPKELRPKLEIIKKAQKIAESSGSKILLTENSNEALRRCDFVHTDVWVSMGEDESVWKQRVNLLKNYQVNSAMMEKTGIPKSKFMHCLPAFHNRKTVVGEKIYQTFGLNGLEVSEAVFESKNAIVFDQAENRLHTIKAVLLATLGQKDLIVS